MPSETRTMKAQWGPRDQKSNFTGSKMGVASTLTFNKLCFDLRLCCNAPRFPFQVSQAGRQLAEIASGITPRKAHTSVYFRGRPSTFLLFNFHFFRKRQIGRTGHPQMSRK